MTSIYAAATKNALSTAALTDLTSEGTSGCKVVIYDADDVVLAEIALSDPAGTVTSNRLQINVAGNSIAVATGTASYVRINKTTGTEFARLNCAQGSAAVANKFIMGSLEVFTGSVIAVSTFFIGDA